MQIAHFYFEVEANKAMATAHNIIRKCVNAEDKLAGLGAERLAEEVPAQESDLKVLRDVRKQLEKRQKYGEIAYHPTPLGACLSTDVCNSRVLVNGFVECISCKDAVITRRELEDEISFQKSRISAEVSADGDSVRAKFLQESVAALEGYARKVFPESI